MQKIRSMTTFDQLNHFFRKLPNPFIVIAFGWSILMSFGLKLSEENKGEFLSNFSYLQRRLNNGSKYTNLCSAKMNVCSIGREKRVGYAVEQGQIDFQDRSSASLACCYYYYYSRLGSTCQKVVTHAIAHRKLTQKPSGFCFLPNQRQISSNNLHNNTRKDAHSLFFLVR